MKWKTGDLFFKAQSPTVIYRVHRVHGTQIYYLPNQYGACPPRGTIRKAYKLTGECASWVNVPRKTGLDKAKLPAHLTIKAEIECCICGTEWAGEEHVASDISSVIQDASEYFHDAGWREKSSGKFQVIGAMCPECAKLKDSDREN